MAGSITLRNGTSRVGLGYVILVNGLSGTIVDQDWIQAYIFTPSQNPGDPVIRHGNTILHGVNSGYIVIGAREKVSAPTQPWHFQLHTDVEDTNAADGISCKVVVEHYSPTAGLVDTITASSLVYDLIGFPEVAFAAIAHFTAQYGELGDILNAVRVVKTTPGQV